MASASPPPERAERLKATDLGALGRACQTRMARETMDARVQSERSFWIIRTRFGESQYTASRCHSVQQDRDRSVQIGFNVLRRVRITEHTLQGCSHVEDGRLPLGSRHGAPLDSDLEAERCVDSVMTPQEFLSPPGTQGGHPLKVRTGRKTQSRSLPDASPERDHHSLIWRAVALQRSEPVTPANDAVLMLFRLRRG